MAFNITSSPTNAEILASLLGDTTGLSNIQITTNGNPLAVGLFQDSLLNLSSGIVLSTGQADRLVGFNANDRDNVSTVFNSPGTVANGNDAITLEITFDADAVGRQLFLQYVFGSEEFLDFAGNSFNDRLTFELNGVNLAKLNNGKPVEVNNLTPSSAPTTFSPDFVPNLSNANPAYYQTVLDGYTVPLTIQGNLLPNAKNRLVITIQDIGDSAVDSAVFLSGGSLGVRNPIPIVNVTTEPPSSADEDGDIGIFYTFTRTGAIDQALSVNYQLGGTATFDTDYITPGLPSPNGTVDFVAGSATATLLITPKTDALVEGNETITVNLLPANNAEYQVGAVGSATGTILDEDTPLNNISLTVSPIEVVEDISGNLIYTFTRTGPTTESLRVDYNVGGTATVIDDYDVRGALLFQSSVGSIQFDVGVSTTTLIIDPRVDFINESTETIALTLTPSRYDAYFGGRSRSYIIDTPNAVVGSILNSPPKPPDVSLVIGPSVVGEYDQTNLSYFFTRTGSTTLPLNVHYSVRGTASLGTDYTVLGAKSFDNSVGTVTFQAGSNFAIVEIVPTRDLVQEISETVILQLDTVAGGIGGYTINNPIEVVGTIVDAGIPIIDVIADNQIVVEGGKTHLFYIFSRSGSTDNAFTVNYNVSGTATFGVDYNQTGANSFSNTAGSITFDAGSSIAKLEIAPVTDLIFDPDETISLTLANSPTYVIGSNISATGSILDVPTVLPSTISLALNRGSVNEEGIANLSYTFTRNGSTTKELNGVRYQITGTAIESSDYSTLGTSTASINGDNFRTFDFAPGASNFTIRVDPTPDTLIEGDETVSLALLPAGLGYGDGQYIVGTATPVTGTIIDDNIPLPIIQVTLALASVVEGGQNLVYLFTRNGSNTQPLTVNYNVGGTAIYNTDYTQGGASNFSSIGGTIFFAENTSTASLVITSIADSIAELDETIVVSLVDGVNSTTPYRINSLNSASGSISDPQPLPTINISAYPFSVIEGDSANLGYQFTRSGSTAQTLIVNYGVGGTATFGADYNPIGATSFNSTSGSITFAAGSDVANLSIASLADSIVEQNETIALSLQTNSNYSLGTTTVATGSIVNKPVAPTITLNIASPTVNEDDTSGLVYFFTRTGSAQESLVVSYIIDGTATAGTDYISSNPIAGPFSNITFNAGSNTATVLIDPTPDTLIEADETIAFTLIPSGSNPYTLGTTNPVIGTILDQDTALNNISLAVTPSQVAEDGTINLVYTFTRTGPTNEALQVDYDFGGTAEFGSDYVVTNANSLRNISTGSVTLNIGTVNFAIGSSTATVIVDPTSESLVEADENVTLKLVAVRSDSFTGGGRVYNISSPDAIAGIITDATPTVSVALTPLTVAEDGAANLLYTLTRTGSTAAALTVRYQVGGTATFNTDYVQTGATDFSATAGTITFVANSSTAILTLNPTIDTTAEPNETVVVTLVDGTTNPTPYKINTSNTATGTIVEPTAIPIPIINVILEPISISEGSSQTLTYRFTRTEPIAQPLTINYSVGGSATFGADYNQTGATAFSSNIGSITFATNSTEAILVISSVADSLLEQNETVSLNLTASAGYVLGTNINATGTIIDNPPLLTSVSVSLNPTTVTEDGAANLVYNFTRTGSTQDPLTVTYSVGGTATSGTDYISSNPIVAATSIVTFNAGSSTAIVSIDPGSDTLVEGDETVTFTLTPSANNQYTVATTAAVTGTILDQDTALNNVSLTVAPAQVAEDGTQNLIYTFTRTGPTNEALKVDYDFGGTAEFVTDYTVTGAAALGSIPSGAAVLNIGTVNFAVGSATATVIIDPTADFLVETDENVTLKLAALRNDSLPTSSRVYNISTPDAIAGTITDATPTVSIALAPPAVAEDGTTNLVYTFTRTGSTTTASTVRYQIGGTATFNTDYTQTGATDFSATAGTITFTANTNTATLVIDPTTDTVAESNETVTVTLIDGTSNSIPYKISTSSIATGTIVEPAPKPISTINVILEPISINEGSSQALTYRFTRTEPTTQPLTVNYSVGGSATFGADYNQTGATTFNSNISSITFAANVTEALLVISSVADSLLEQNETVSLNLAASADYVLGTNVSATGTIIDNPPPLPIVAVSLNPTTVTEDGVTNLAYTFTRTGSITAALTVRYNISGTASFGTDYLQTGAFDFKTNTGRIIFEANSNTAILSLTPVSDNISESNETIDLTLLGAGYGNPDYVIGTPSTVTGTIIEPVVTVTNLPSTAIVFNGSVSNNQFLIAENTNTINSIKLADIAITDDQLGTNSLSISGADVSSFELIGTSLFLRAGVLLDFETRTNYDVTVSVDDVTVGSTPDATNDFKLIVTDVNELPTNGLNFIGTTNLDVGTINNLANGIFAVNPNNVNLVGDEINLLAGIDSVTVPGKNITLQPDRPTQAIQIGGVDSKNTNILDLTPTDLATIANGFSKIIIGRTNGTGNIDISSTLTFRDPILLQSPGGQLNIAAPIILTDDATLDFNVKTLAKSGSSTLTINGNTATTFIGNTTINGGILLLAKSANTEALNNALISINSGVLQLGNNEQINNAADLTLNGGTLNLNGFNETLDRLQVTSNSTINLGNGSSKLSFGNSSTANWTGVLSIDNWSSTSGESIRFSNSTTGLTAAQLSNIQFVGFGRGANINASGFITPVGIAVINPTPDQDGVSDDIEDLAANDGDGNFDGIRDSLQENVASLLNLDGENVNDIATIIAKVGAKISGLRSLANPITTATLTSLANPIEFKVTGLSNGAATTVEYLIAKADQNRNYNTYLMFGATADNRTPHAYEFLYDGQTGAELFDTNGDGFTDKAVVHFVDGLRGDSDLTVNGEIQDPGAPGVSNTPVGLSADANNVVQVTGSAGTAIAKFSLVANQTKKVNEVGFFKIDNTNKVKGIAANGAGFAQAALQNGQVIFSSLADNLLNAADISRQLQLNAGDRLGFYLVQNGTVDAALQKNDFSNVVFSLDPANPAGKKVLEVTTESNGSYRLKWEQGNTEVNDDLILNLQLQNTPLNNQNLVAGIQGKKESELLDLSSFTGQNVQVNFTIKREAAYNNTVGFYKIEDAQGTVLSITGVKLKPGEAGYQDAVVQNRIAGIDLEVANGQTISIDKVLQGGAIYAPFLIANANANNLNGNFSNVYTPYTLGNSDATDHVRLLGDNTFGFEDLVSAGDKDFNDVVLKAVFKNS
jgi:autotransporter-associated beta strand protein